MGKVAQREDVNKEPQFLINASDTLKTPGSGMDDCGLLTAR